MQEVKVAKPAVRFRKWHYLRAAVLVNSFPAGEGRDKLRDVFIRFLDEPGSAFDVEVFSLMCETGTHCTPGQLRAARLRLQLQQEKEAIEERRRCEALL